MSEQNIIDSALKSQRWHVVHFQKEDDGGSVIGYKKHTALLILGFAPGDDHVRHLSRYAKEVPTGETMAAGDRFRRALEVIHAPVPIQ